jgi:hypothetical protein
MRHSDVATITMQSIAEAKGALHPFATPGVGYAWQAFRISHSTVSLNGDETRPRESGRSHTVRALSVSEMMGVPRNSHRLPPFPVSPSETGETRAAPMARKLVNCEAARVSITLRQFHQV